LPEEILLWATEKEQVDPMYSREVKILKMEQGGYSEENLRKNFKTLIADGRFECADSLLQNLTVGGKVLVWVTSRDSVTSYLYGQYHKVVVIGTNGERFHARVPGETTLEYDEFYLGEATGFHLDLAWNKFTDILVSPESLAKVPTTEYAALLRLQDSKLATV
jgi:hypothetical protein